MSRSSRESRAVLDAIGAIAARQDEIDAQSRETKRERDTLGGWQPQIVPAIWTGKRMIPLHPASAPVPVAPPAPVAPVVPERRIIWRENGRQMEITQADLQAKVAGWVTTAMAYTPERRKDADVARWIGDLERNITTLVATGAIPADRGTFLLGRMRATDAPAPVVNVTVPVPVVHVVNNVDARPPQGDLKLTYDKLGRLDELKRVES